VVDAIKAGVKGVYCEKPIATTLADADRMIEAAEEAGVPITVNHSRRWRPIFRPAFDTLEKGAIGELKHIVVNYGGPRAMLFRNGTHMIDTICMFARSEPEWVFAELQEGYEDYWPYKGDGGRNPDLEPGVCGYIHFKNGVRAFYNNNKTMTGVVREWELFGTEGRIIVNDKHAELETAAGKKKIDCPHHMLVDSPSAIRELIDVIENGGETCSPPRQARRVLEVLLGFMASQKKGNVRIDFPLDENAV
jgi:predicted dehydrogenase